METEGREGEIVNRCVSPAGCGQKNAWEQTKEGMHTGVPAQAVAKDDLFWFHPFLVKCRTRVASLVGCVHDVPTRQTLS